MRQPMLLAMECPGMKIRVLGGGFYGCHIGLSLIEDGHDVEVHEIRDGLFAGASGAIPARLHTGAHYPRSRMTRAACQEHQSEFMAAYGWMTRGVPINIYAVAAERSLVDFDQYVATLRGEIDFIPIHDPTEFGLKNVEGAILTGERHILTDLARQYFAEQLDGMTRFSRTPDEVDSADWDWTIDATFCANHSAGVDRYEPCLVLLLEGRCDIAVTVMDGPFGSVYPFLESLGLSSLSSARWTPFSKSCRTWAEAGAVIAGLSRAEINAQAEAMIASMAEFYPAIRDYRVVDHMLSVRAMPASGADTRLVDVAHVGERALRVRAGKIDAIIHAAREIKRMIL